MDIIGRLITYKSGDDDSDSGLRFEKGEGDTHVRAVYGASAREG